MDVMRLKLDAGRRAMVVDKDAKIVTERRKNLQIASSDWNS